MSAVTKTRWSEVFDAVERKWQQKWLSAKLFAAKDDDPAPKYYILDMFPYPSAAGLHVGHPEGYTASDIMARFKRMNGFKVLHPMGWDAFGLPAENYALQTNVHPAITTAKNIATFKRQLQRLGFSIDWEREVNTTDSSYYRWTQWIFLQLYRRGLAYEAQMPINWCPSCKTGLANEEVHEGNCERCGAPVEHKNLRQWVLRITQYADRLLNDLEGLDWPASTLAMQRNWIGRSEGANIRFPLAAEAGSLKVYTTRPDTLHGATYMVIAPEHPSRKTLTTKDQKATVEAYCESAGHRTERERSDAGREKSGVFTGGYVLHPLSGDKLPVWVADYVLGHYGTGAIMAVPAHDLRDWEFARKFALPIRPVVNPPAGYKPSKEEAAMAVEEGGRKSFPFTGIGTAINSEGIDGLPTPQAKKRMIEILVEKELGEAAVQYKLRDWVFSRQRYWGEPIPIIHCPHDGVVPVPEEMLPVRLPEVENYHPTGTGESPLAAVENWVKTTCPKCGGPARRETNTMPQWAGSCWYYLRYLSPHNGAAPFDAAKANHWLPVDLYVGGAEHAVLHLLYARFWHKVLFDLGMVQTPEPFKALRHQGMILAFSFMDAKGVYHHPDEVEVKEGGAFLKRTGETLVSQSEKMSKTKQNVVNPDDVVARYGADALRCYEMFMGPFEAVKPWDTHGIEGIARFLNRVYRVVFEFNRAAAVPGAATAPLRHKTIRKVSEDIAAMRFNTALAALMSYLNELPSTPAVEDLEALILLLYPFAPHLAEEGWARLGHSDFALKQPWPVYDPALCIDTEIEIPVQINGKLRATLKIAREAEAGAVIAAAKADESVARHIAGKTLVKEIYVPGRIVTLVVK